MARLEAEGAQTVGRGGPGDADPARWDCDRRRAAPTIAQVDAFLADRRPVAYEKLVERLLDSPHYGERWGRIWLDAASTPTLTDMRRISLREVFFYRDWVIGYSIATCLMTSSSSSRLLATSFQERRRTRLSRRASSAIR